MGALESQVRAVSVVSPGFRDNQRAVFPFNDPD